MEISFKKIFYNRIEYYNDKGQKHRIDNPAVEYYNGNKSWYLNGQFHREDGPAACIGESKFWYLNNKLHREDGPSIEWDNVMVWNLDHCTINESDFIQTLTNQAPNPNLFKDLFIEDLEELAADLSDKYLGEVKQWINFYAIYFKEKLDKNDLDLKSFENRLDGFRMRIGLKSILVY